jgi:hypothetical protein
VVYRRYASLFFVTGIAGGDNELVTLEMIHRYVEVLDRYFGNVSALDMRLERSRPMAWRLVDKSRTRTAMLRWDESALAGRIARWMFCLRQTSPWRAPRVINGTRRAAPVSCIAHPLRGAVLLSALCATCPC